MRPYRPSCRALLAVSAAAAAIPMTAAARTAFAGDVPPYHPDAKLIRVCRQFAEVELENLYLYIIRPDELADKLAPPPDFETFRWIAETPATTPEGWHAKALVYSAWDNEAYDDPEFSRGPTTTFLAALLRDMVAPARDAIVAKLREKHGPLPDNYSPNLIWLRSANA